MFDLVEVSLKTAYFIRTDAPTFDPLGDQWDHQRYNAERFPLAHSPREWLHYRLRKARRGSMTSIDVKLRAARNALRNRSSHF